MTNEQAQEKFKKLDLKIKNLSSNELIKLYAFYKVAIKEIDAELSKRARLEMSTD